MSHLESCPEPYEARRAGERAFERGGSRYYGGYDCDEANYEYRRGYARAEERRAEEEAEERASRRRYEAQQSAEEESYYLAQAAADYYASEEAAYRQQCADAAKAQAENEAELGSRDNG